VAVGQQDGVRLQPVLAQHFAEGLLHTDARVHDQTGTTCLRRDDIAVRPQRECGEPDEEHGGVLPSTRAASLIGDGGITFSLPRGPGPVVNAGAGPPTS
jgi:hypothetical protein